MKKSIIPVAAFIAGMAIVPSVFAAEEVRPTDPIAKGTDLKKCLEAKDLEEGKTQVCVLDSNYDNKDAIKDATFGKSVVLDLNGHDLKFSSAISVADGSELTIKNSNKDVAKITNTAGVSVAAGGTFTLDTNVVYNGTGLEAHAFSNQGTLIINGNVADVPADKYAVWSYSGSVVINNAELAGTVGIDGGNLTAEGATIAPAAGSALILNSVSKNVITVDVAKSTLTSKDSDVIRVIGDQVAGMPTSAFDLENTSVNLEAIKAYGNLKSFKLANVNLSTEGAGKHVYSNTASNNIAFKEWSVDGKTSEEAALNTLAVYNTINDAVVDPTDEPEKPTDDGTENPNTADTIATYMTIAAVALLGLGATAFVAKKSNR